MCNKLRGPVDHPFVGEGGLFFKRHRGPHLMNHDPSFLRLLNLIYLLAHSTFLAVRKFIPLSGSAVTYPPGPPTSSLRKGRVLISSLEVSASGAGSAVCYCMSRFRVRQNLQCRSLIVTKLVSTKTEMNILENLFIGRI